MSLEPDLKKFFSGLHFLWYSLKELEEKSRKWESRSEDTHLINCLQDKLSEREEIIKQLVVRLLFICILESVERLYSVFHALLQAGCFFLFWNTLTNVSFHTRFQQIHVSIHITLFPSRKEENVNIHFQPTLNLTGTGHFLSTLIQYA